MSVKSNRVEGDGYSKLTQAIRKVGYNKDVTIRLATVIAPPPSIKLKVDGISFDLDKDDVIIAENLTEHERTWRLKPDGTKQTYIIDCPLKKGDRVIVIQDNNVFYVIDKAVM